MVADSDAKDPLTADLSEGLNDDLGDDWESAFQAEDFMVSPEDEPESFFIKDDDSAEDMDLTSFLTQEEATHSAKATSPSDETTDSDKKSEVNNSRSIATPSFFHRCRSWFTSRSRTKKLLFPLIVILSAIAVSATIFFRSTTEQLAQESTEDNTPPKTTITPKPLPPTIPQVINLPAPTKKTTPTIFATKIRRKWPLPAFLITVQDENNNKQQVVARIDLTLVLLLESGHNIPKAKQSFIRDSIFKFYSNRPAKQLRHYALARGEMIHNLESWLKKDWPDNSLTAIIFNRYEIVK
jgi:hypothetical protein